MRLILVLTFTMLFAADREVIVQNVDSYNWDELDREILSYIFDFMIEQGDCSESEIMQLQKFRKTSSS